MCTAELKNKWEIYQKYKQCKETKPNRQAGGKKYTMQVTWELSKAQKILVYQGNIQKLIYPTNLKKSEDKAGNKTD